MNKTIWCLFSIDNEYNQPDNNLVTFWFTRPTFHDVKKFFEPTPRPAYLTSQDHCYGQLSRGEGLRLGHTDYRIQEVTEGNKPDER